MALIHSEAYKRWVPGLLLFPKAAGPFRKKLKILFVRAEIRFIRGHAVHKGLHPRLMNVRDDRCEDRQQGEHDRKDDEKGVPDVPVDFSVFPFGVFEAVDVVHDITPENSTVKVIADKNGLG